MSSEHKIPGKSEQGGKAGAPAERTHKDKKEVRLYARSLTAHAKGHDR